MKYGKNQWSRISSLLVRKTPKQCKARWYEWLDPSIKKTEWSKDEDEKLLHLAKLMPTQWRTIAPIVGRTPSQCLERYQKLLDEAEEKDGDEEAKTGDEVRRLRPGEIDPDPETKPARPDPVDMDEDEKEMLSEARARLANTQGKKAKRKAREKQLEEARRLAALQKRRELKAAGIDMKLRTKRRGQMDYNADIPFHHKAPAGFFDTGEEKARELAEKKDLMGAALQKLEGKRRSEIEEMERKKDAKKQKVRKENGDAKEAALLAENAASFRTPRSKLNLPAPQVSEGELEEIVRIGQAGETTKNVVDTDDLSSKLLLGDYTALNVASTRTPQTPAAIDTIKSEARNHLAMLQSQTPLLGEEVSDTFAGTGFSGITPRRNVASTPNPLAQMTPRTDMSGMTPRSSMTPGSSAASSRVMRDQMKINTPREGSSFGDTPRAERGRQSLIRKQLSESFSNLPKPKNEFEIVVPEITTDLEEEDVPKTLQQVEDAADLAKKADTARKEAADLRFRMKSRVLQKGLPRPISIRPSMFEDAEPGSVEDLINREMLQMLVKDGHTEQAHGQLPLPRIQRTMIDLKESELNFAGSLIAEELEKMDIRTEADDEEFEKRHKSIVDEYVLVPTVDSESPDGTALQWVKKADLSPDELFESYRSELESCRTYMKEESQRAAKFERKLGTILGGYQARSTKLKLEYKELWEQYVDGILSLESFRLLKELETEERIPQRIERAKKEVMELKMREKELQERYRQLTEEKEQLEIKKRFIQDNNEDGGGQTMETD
ncbi:CDC5 cell division cycle 5-like protein [Nowakowskiella sp. JEL0407]|nr:CDC5 cell division cycle 5-like protein [Nowakowskiella sp. JEL0407]